MSGEWNRSVVKKRPTDSSNVQDFKGIIERRLELVERGLVDRIGDDAPPNEKQSMPLLEANLSPSHRSDSCILSVPPRARCLDSAGLVSLETGAQLGNGEGNKNDEENGEDEKVVLA